MFIAELFSRPRWFAAAALVVVFSICAHEFMHAYVALKQGDPTAADAGHLTMNPFRQMGWWSLIMLALLGIAWGQVPVNPDNLRTRKARVAVALAGVAANLVLAVIFAGLCALTLRMARENGFAVSVLLYASAINLVLAAINLFPVPGFDGWNVLREFWRPSSVSETVNGAFFIMLMLLFFCIDYIQTGAGYAAIFLVRLLSGGGK